MEMNSSSMLNIKKQLYDDIKLYCEANSIVDIELFCNQILETGFNIEKYGTTPAFIKNVEKKVDQPVSENENVVSLPPQIKTETTTKIYKKANLNDDYRVYDNI
jgi:hypothetical protein